MPKVLIVYYPRSGNTEAMAKLIAEGVESEGVDVELKRIEDTVLDDLLSPDGIILGSPTYYGTMSADIKKLLDDSVKYHGKLDGKVGAAFSSSGGIGGGNETTILDMLKAFLVWKGIHFDEVHNLTYLLDLCESAEAKFASLRSMAEKLTPYAVKIRYPTKSIKVNQKKARESLIIAETVWKFITDIMPKDWL